MKNDQLLIFCLPFALVGVYMSLQWYDSVAHLSDDDLLWMQAYEKGDTIFFREQNSDSEDTLIVDYNNIENNYLPFSPDFIDWRDDYHGMGLTDMTLKHSGNSYERNCLFIKRPFHKF